MRFDTEGKGTVFNLPVLALTVCNVYYPSGAELQTKNKWEEYSRKIVLELLLDHLPLGIICGDFNAIISKADCIKM